MTDLPCEAVIASGLVLLLAGVVWRRVVDRHKGRVTAPRPASPETGGHRSSYLLVLVGGVWTLFGVIRCLG